MPVPTEGSQEGIERRIDDASDEWGERFGDGGVTDWMEGRNDSYQARPMTTRQKIQAKL